MNLWIDDLRLPPEKGWLWAKSSEDAIALLKGRASESKGIVSFDHDLGGDDTTRPVVIWMIENNVRFNEYGVHTQNPIGREWLVGMIERYLL